LQSYDVSFNPPNIWDILRSLVTNGHESGMKWLKSDEWRNSPFSYADAGCGGLDSSDRHYGDERNASDPDGLTVTS